jgi:hypothetical protein
MVLKRTTAVLERTSDFPEEMNFILEKSCAFVVIAQKARRNGKTDFIELVEFLKRYFLKVTNKIAVRFKKSLFCFFIITRELLKHYGFKN